MRRAHFFGKTVVVLATGLQDEQDSQDNPANSVSSC